MTTVNIASYRSLQDFGRIPAPPVPVPQRPLWYAKTTVNSITSSDGSEEFDFTISASSQIDNIEALKLSAEHAPLLYIHGFNNSARSVAIRAAQLKRDLDLKGDILAFIWPSVSVDELRGSNPNLSKLGALTEAYQDVEREFEYTPGKLIEVLQVLPEDTEVLAHSFGNHIVAEAFKQSLDKNVKLPKYGNVIHAAADISTLTMLSNYAPELKRIGKSRSCYTNRWDVALLASVAAHASRGEGFYRVGQTPGVLAMKFLSQKLSADYNLIDCTAAASAAPTPEILQDEYEPVIPKPGPVSNFFGINQPESHGYYATTPEVIEDIKGLLTDQPIPRPNLQRPSLISWIVGDWWEVKVQKSMHASKPVAS